jgi:hypothetical protein
VENHHLLWLLLPIWILLTAFIKQRNVAGVFALAGIFVLLSQPFRIARLLVAVVPTNQSSEFVGGAVLELGGLLLCLLFLAVMIGQRFMPFAAVSPGAAAAPRESRLASGI